MTDRPTITVTFSGGDLYVGGKIIGTLNHMNVQIEAEQHAAELFRRFVGQPDLRTSIRQRLAEQFGEHPKRIFYEGA